MSDRSSLRLLVRDATGHAGAELGEALKAHGELTLIGAEEADARVREIVTGQLALDAAVIIVDAAAGLITAVRREAYLMSLVGVSAAVFAILEDRASDGSRYHTLARECSQFARRIGLAPVTCIPVPSQEGWFTSPTLLEFLRGLATAAPTPSVERGPELPEADQIRATIVWTHPNPLLRGRSYTLRTSRDELAATVAPIKHRLELDTLEPVAATQLLSGEIGDCDLELSGSIDAAAYGAREGSGGFVLDDPVTGEPAGVGLVRFGLRRAQNLRWQPLTVTSASRATRLGQTPCVLWLTGLSGAGKSTIANQLEADLHALGHHTYLLDGDNVRQGLNRDLGFTDADRVENIRRVAEVAKLMVDAGLIVIVSFISPFRSERDMARRLFASDRFFEIYVDTPLAVAEERDPKGLYRKARRGELRNFTGIDSAYEPPEAPDLRLPTTELAVPEAAAEIIALLRARDVLEPG